MRYDSIYRYRTDRLILIHRSITNLQTAELYRSLQSETRHNLHTKTRSRSTLSQSTWMKSSCIYYIFCRFGSKSRNCRFINLFRRQTGFPEQAKRRF